MAFGSQTMADIEDLDDTSSLIVHRGYKIHRDKQFGTFSVTKIGKGPIPKSLSGSFQSPKMVIRLIDEFLNKSK